MLGRPKICHSFGETLPNEMNHETRLCQEKEIVGSRKIKEFLVFFAVQTEITAVASPLLRLVSSSVSLGNRIIKFTARSRTCEAARNGYKISGGRKGKSQLNKFPFPRHRGTLVRGEQVNKSLIRRYRVYAQVTAIHETCENMSKK